MNPLKLISILIKPVEIALLVAGMGFVAYFTKELHDFVTKDDPDIDPYDLGSYGRYEFFMYTTAVGVGIAVLGLVCTLTGLLEKKHGALATISRILTILFLTKINTISMMAAVQAIWTLQLIVSTALVTKILFTYKKDLTYGGETMSTCESWDKEEDKGNRDYHYTCGQVTGGVVCGFVGMAAFAVDTVISLFFYGQSSHQYQ